MRIKIDEVGYEAFDGFLGTVEFKGGISVNSLSEGDINRISSVIRVVDLENPEDEVGALAQLSKNGAYIFPVEIPVTNAGDEKAKEVTQNESKPVEEKTLEVKESLPLFTREQLEELADKEGISGLRAIADTFNLKGTSIVNLIDGILNAQALTK